MISGSGFLVKVVQTVLYGVVNSLGKGCLVLWGGYSWAVTWAGACSSATEALWWS